jgi:signal transduction histidine kinase
MAREIKQLRKQAEKAARAAKAAADAEVSEQLRTLAHAFQSQADVLKSKKSAGKKHKKQR